MTVVSAMMLAATMVCGPLLRAFSAAHALSFFLSKGCVTGDAVRLHLLIAAIAHAGRAGKIDGCATKLALPDKDILILRQKTHDGLFRLFPLLIKTILLNDLSHADGELVVKV